MSILEFLDFSKNRISHEGITYFIEGLKFNSTLVSLNLFNNRLNDMSAIQMCKMLKDNNTLLKVKLNYNNIKEKFRNHLKNILRLNIEKSKVAIKEKMEFKIQKIRKTLCTRFNTNIDVVYNLKHRCKEELFKTINEFYKMEKEEEEMTRKLSDKLKALQMKEKEFEMSIKEADKNIMNANRISEYKQEMMANKLNKMKNEADLKQEELKSYQVTFQILKKNWRYEIGKIEECLNIHKEKYINRKTKLPPLFDKINNNEIAFPIKRIKKVNNEEYCKQLVTSILNKRKKNCQEN